MSKSTKTRRTRKTQITRRSRRVRARKTKPISAQRVLFNKVTISHLAKVVAILIGIFVVFWFIKGRAAKKQEGTLNKDTPSVYNESNNQSVTKPGYSPWTKKELAKKLSQYTQIPEEDLIFDVTEKIVKGNKHFLYGALGEKGVTGGKHFYVVVEAPNRTQGRAQENLAAQYSIRIIYVGSVHPNCSIFDGLDVPSEWLSRCVK